MSVVHLIDHADFGQLQIDDPEHVRVDREGEHEFYVMIIDGSFEQTAYSLHDNAADAEGTAAALAKRLRCNWGTNYRRRRSAAQQTPPAELRSAASATRGEGKGHPRTARRTCSPICEITSCACGRIAPMAWKL